MKNAIKEGLREFCQDGLPSGIARRDVECGWRNFSWSMKSMRGFSLDMRMRNAVFMALRRRQARINCYSLCMNREVDFCVYDQVPGTPPLLQVSWDLADGTMSKRELVALRETRAATGIDDCTIVTWDDEKMPDDGIRTVPVWKWCLEKGK